MSGAASAKGRMTFAARAVVLLLAVTVSCALVAVLGSQAHVRIDMTATRQHRLSERSAAVLAKLTAPIELVVAADFASLDRATRDRAADVLDAFSQASDRLKVTTIDTTSPSGVAAFDALLARLAERDGPAIERHMTAVRGAADKAETAAGLLGQVADRLGKVRDALRAVPAPSNAVLELTRYWDGQSAAGRILADELRAGAAAARQTLARNADPLPLPDLDLATRQVRAPIARLASELTTLNTAVDTFARQADMPKDARDEAAEAGGTIPGLRDTLAREAAMLEGLNTPPIVAAARVIQRTRAGLIIGPEGGAGVDAEGKPRPALAAIDLDDLLPLPTAEAGVIDQRARAEDVLAAAVARFTGEVRPLVVFTHAASQRLGADLGPLRLTAERLGLRGFDAVEWAVALDDQPPVAAAPGSGRPVVFVTISIEVGSPESAARMGRLSAALRRLIDEGRSVLVSVNPSSLPGAGAPDPMVDMLPALGLVADSGRPLLEEVPPPPRRSVVSDAIFADPMPTAEATPHPISAALSGMSTLLPWPIPLRAGGPEGQAPGVRVEPLVQMAASPRRWAESSWALLRATPVARRDDLPELPAKDSPSDDAGGAEPWTIAAAITRPLSGGKEAGEQRLVVVGSNGWFFDNVAQRQVLVDGRPRYEFPGNTEFLASSAAWLTGRSELLARSAATQAVPTIPALSEAQRSALRWLLIGAMPLMALLAGVVFRWWRG